MSTPLKLGLALRLVATIWEARKFTDPWQGSQTPDMGFRPLTWEPDPWPIPDHCWVLPVLMLFCRVVSALTVGWRSGSLVSAYCGDPHIVATRILGDPHIVTTCLLWRPTYCVNPLIVTIRILWQPAYCGDTHIVATRILWRHAYFGDSHIEPTRTLWRSAYCEDYPMSQCYFMIEPSYYQTNVAPYHSVSKKCIFKNAFIWFLTK